MRPTTDKLRSSVFSILSDRIVEASVLDAFAGTGAFGLESYSRGAGRVVFLDTDIASVKSNIGLFPKDFPVGIKKGDFFKSLRLCGGGFDIIFIDPPYGLYESGKVLNSLSESGVLNKGGVAIYEEFFKTPFTVSGGFNISDERRYGDTIVRFLEVSE